MAVDIVIAEELLREALSLPDKHWVAACECEWCEFKAKVAKVLDVPAEWGTDCDSRFMGGHAVG